MEDFIIDDVGVWRIKNKCYYCGNTKDTYECEICKELICEGCQAGYNQFTQIDFNCCKTCSEKKHD